MDLMCDAKEDIDQETQATMDQFLLVLEPPLSFVTKQISVLMKNIKIFDKQLYLVLKWIKLEMKCQNPDHEPVESTMQILHWSIMNKMHLITSQKNWRGRMSQKAS